MLSVLAAREGPVIHWTNLRLKLEAKKLNKTHASFYNVWCTFTVRGRLMSHLCHSCLEMPLSSTYHICLASKHARYIPLPFSFSPHQWKHTFSQSFLADNTKAPLSQHSICHPPLPHMLTCAYHLQLPSLHTLHWVLSNHHPVVRCLLPPNSLVLHPNPPCLTNPHPQHNHSSTPKLPKPAKGEPFVCPSILQCFARPPLDCAYSCSGYSTRCDAPLCSAMCSHFLAPVPPTTSNILSMTEKLLEPFCEFH